MSFFEQLMASFPADLQPPDELVRYFAWVQKQGCTHTEGKHVYANVDPSQTQSHVALEPVDPEHACYWLDIVDPAITNRLAAFCRTGGDGSRAALWRDDAGTVRIVHLGSGSGSVMVGVLGQTPLDFLRLLAIGYQELCWPDELYLTPQEVFDEQQADDPDNDELPPVPPLALRAWLKTEFGVDVPDTADEIVGDLPSMDRGGDTTDPFYRWLSQQQGEDEQGAEGDDVDAGSAGEKDSA